MALTNVIDRINCMFEALFAGDRPGTPERGQEGASVHPAFCLGEQGEQKCLL